MTKFPEPPSAKFLAQTQPDWIKLEPDTRLWRLYFRGGEHGTLWRDMRRYGPCQARFDHHQPPTRLQRLGILYAALAGPTCLAEVFQASRVIDRRALAPWLCAFDLTKPLRLLNLTGSWPARAGASMAITSGPRPRSQRWARVIYQAYKESDGIYYPSSMHANRPAIALFERGARAIPKHPAFHRALADPCLTQLIHNAAVDLGYSLR